MDFYYPNRIADDDYDDSSCCSAEIEGGVSTVRTASGGIVSVGGSGSALHTIQEGDGQSIPKNNNGGSAKNKNADDNGGRDSEYGPGGISVEKALLFLSPGKEHDKKGGEKREGEDAIEVGPTTNASNANEPAGDEHEHKINPMAALIQNERNRRLGLTPPPVPSNETPAAPISGGVLGYIGGWFGGGGTTSSANQSTPTRPNRRFPAPAINVNPTRQPSTPVRGRSIEHQSSESQLATNMSYNENEEDGYSSSSSSDESSSDEDSDTSSQSSNASNNHQKQDADLTPQERARVRALRHLSNSCVDARRKAKTISYVRGLERLDLERKRDKYVKELKVVEAEMTKDRGLINDGRERDAISAKARQLVCELPRIQGADAGAGSSSDRGTGEGSFMSYDEYADALHNDDANFHTTDNQKPRPSLWENKEAVVVYVNSLQGRLKEALGRARSLEKRLVVLEQAGDDIVSSLCEDLAEVTGHANKAEARYVKKGKELQRKRRREELKHRSKLKQAERRVQILEKQLMALSGGSSGEYFEEDDSFGDSTSSEDDDLDDGEHDEIMLEKKLSSVKSKNEQDKEHHESEADSIRRQCEQLKLRLSVARLVMEGDDNLREYVALLERLNPSTQHQRKNSTSGDYNDHDFSTMPSPPPSRITRARAKLLKVTHLERIYTQRLTVSKAFTDATINALEQELTEREQDSQMMEVKCLNELVVIDSGIKDAAKEADDKIEDFESEIQALQDAVDGILAQNTMSDINDMFGDNNAAIESSVAPKGSELVENGERSDVSLSQIESSSERSIDEKEVTIDTGLASDDSWEAENDVLDKLHPWRSATKRANSINYDSSSDMSIGEKDYNEEQISTGSISDVDSCRAENDNVDKVERSKAATGATVSSAVESTRESSIKEADSMRQQVETGLPSDGASCQAENDIVDESHPWRSVKEVTTSIDNDSSRKRSIDEKDNIQKQQREGSSSDAESLQIEDKIVKMILQNSTDSAEKSPLPAAFDPDGVDAVNEKIVHINHDVSTSASEAEDYVTPLSMSRELEEMTQLLDNDLGMTQPRQSTEEDDERQRKELSEEIEEHRPSSPPVPSTPASKADDCVTPLSMSRELEEMARVLDNDLEITQPRRNTEEEDERQRVYLPEELKEHRSSSTPVPSTPASEADDCVTPLSMSRKLEEMARVLDNDLEMAQPRRSTEEEDERQRKDLLDTENDFEGIEGANEAKLDSLEATQTYNQDKTIDDSSFDGREAANQHKSQLESPTDQACPDVDNKDRLSVLIGNDGNDENLDAADEDHISQSCSDENIETGSELPDSNTHTDLHSGGIVHGRIIDTKGGGKIEEQRQVVVQMLGRELRGTLAEYQTSFDLSSSQERIDYLEYMNDLVLKIAKTQGIEIEPTTNGPSGGGDRRRMQSWTHKRSPHKSPKKGRSDKKRSKEKKTKKKRHRIKERKEGKKDELDILEHPHIW